MCYKCVFEQAHVPRVFRVGVRVHLTYKARSYEPSFPSTDLFVFFFLRRGVQIGRIYIVPSVTNQPIFQFDLPFLRRGAKTFFLDEKRRVAVYHRRNNKLSISSFVKKCILYVYKSVEVAQLRNHSRRYAR